MKKILYNESDKADFITFIQKKEVNSATRVEFTKVKRKRSLNSNSYLWLLHTIEEEYTGTDKSDLYAFYLWKFPTFKEIEVNNEIHLVPISSSGFDSGQMSMFIDCVRREMSINGMSTPDPDSERAVEAFNHYREQGKL